MTETEGSKGGWGKSMTGGWFVSCQCVIVVTQAAGPGETPQGEEGRGARGVVMGRASR